MNPLHLIDSWSVASQQRARRNAMIASTALAQRRAEIDDVEDFLDGPHTVAVTPAGATRQAVGHG